MKKVLALMLAFALALSMSTVALAASTTELIAVHDGTLYTYNSSSEKMSEVTDNDLKPGTTYYIWVENLDESYNDGADNIKSTRGLEEYRLSYSVEEGKKFISSVGFAIKEVSNPDAMGAAAKGKHAFISITLGSVYSSNYEDIDMEIRVTGKSNSYKVSDNGDEEREYRFSFSYEMGYEVDEVDSIWVTADPNTPIINFDGIDESDEGEISFDNDVYFTVVLKGQKELFLKYSDDPTGTKYNVDDKYPDADLEYHLFLGNNKTFRKTGTLHIPATSLDNGKAPYIYTISDSGKLTQLKAKYDDDEQEFLIETKELENYVVSDIKLSAAAASSSEDDEDESSSKSSSSKSSSSTTPTPPPTNYPGNNDNPATGANDFVGIAVALTVVSFAAIGAASVKKRK